MRQKLLGILAFVMGLISHNNVFADINKLELQAISIESGSTEVVLPVLLTNENEISGFQCDLYLPEGVEVAKDGDDDFIIDIARTTVKRHSVNARLLPDGVFRIVCSSMKNSTFSGNSGIVLNITLKVKVDKSAGTYDMALRNVVLTGPAAERYTSDDVSAKLTINGVSPIIVKVKSCSRTYGDNNPTFEYSVEGGTLEGEPEIICEATTTSPVGVYPISIKKGSIKNNNVTLSAGTLTITKAPLNVSVANYDKRRGEANPEFIINYGGFKNDENEDVLKTKPTVTTDATEESAPGEYDIIINGGEADNYTLIYSKGKLTILDWDPIIISGKTYTREYGESNPEFEYIVESGILDGEPEVICEADATSPIGEYPITIKKGSIQDEDVTFNAGKLIITPAPLTVSVGNYSRKKGESNPEFTINYKGFKNNENEDILKVKPTVTTTATMSSEPGVYDIVVSGGEAENYKLSYVNGKLSVLLPYNNVLSLSDINMPLGNTEAILSILLTNETDISGFQCDLYLPNGIEVAKNETGDYKIEVLRSKGKHEVLPRQLSDGALRILCGSMGNEKFSGNSGVVLQLTLNVEDNYAVGKYDIGLKNIILTDPEVNRYTSDDTSSTLSISAPIIITAKSYTREYGESNPAFEYSSEGAELDGTPEIICEATATSPVGEYPIIIKKGSVTNYNDTYVNGVLTITKAPLTITAKSYTIKQGDALPAFEADYSGFKNNESKDVLTKQASFSCVATSSSAPGKYDIEVSGAEAQNYEISYNKGTLTINNADPVTVTASSYTIAYGDAIPELGFTSNGAALNGKPSISCEATSTSPVGTYPIIISKGSVTNYNDTYVNGVLTITKAPLTVSVGNYTRKQGEENPAFTISYSGFKNNETEGVLTKKPTAITTATASSEPGEYDILASGGEAENYSLSYKNGKLTVVKADAIVITAKSYTREYGDANPTFEYTVDGATLEGTPEIICEATATSPVGEYPIIIKKGSVTNYNDTYVNGVLTITKAPLTITAESYTKKQYDSMPEFSVSYEGFKNNETEKVLTKQPVISCEANEDSEPGVYDIVVSGAEAQNYEMKYVAGKLTVTEPDFYTLTYMVDGKEYRRFAVKYRESITPLEAPEKEGYTFSGWSEIPETMPAKDVVITGSFTINSYTVTYVLDGEIYTTETLEYGAKVIPPVISGLEDYTIWESVPETMPANDITIYGKAKDIIDSLTPTISYGKGEVFDLNGRKLSAPQKGLNIIRMSDGTSKKVMIR